MISLNDLLDAPTTCPLEVRVRPTWSPHISRVALIEELGRSNGLEPGTLAVLSQSTAAFAHDYQFDLFVRLAIESGVVGVVLRRSTRRSLTAEALAAHGNLAILETEDEIDAARAFDQLSILVAGDSRADLRRLATISHLVEEEDEEPDALLRRIAKGCGIPLEYDPASASGGLPVIVEGSHRGKVHSTQAGDVGIIAARLAASALAESIGRRERLVFAPIRTTSAALSQLLLCSQANLTAVASRAGEVGLDTSGWHCAARLAVGDAKRQGGAVVDLPELEQEVLRWVAEQTRADPCSWSVARPDDTVVLIRSTRMDSRRAGTGEVANWMKRLVDSLCTLYPGLAFRVGVATSHEGPTGLRISADESRTALAAARLNEGAVGIATFDTLGSGRMLAEWLVTDSARMAVSELLAPLDALGEVKCATAVATLHAYLDERGSLLRTASRLHIHRNAVVYRIDGISRALALDLGDPEIRFALQLACRARLMGAGLQT